MTFRILLGAALLVSSAAFGVSRVGTGKLSNDEIGFAAPVPQIFERSVINAQGDFRFEGPMIFNPNANLSPAPLYLIVSLLSNRLPQWIGKTDRAEFGGFYLNKGWVKVAHPNACVEVYRTDTETNRNWVLSWGDGKGILVAVPLLNLAIGEVDLMIQKLELDSGACAWN